jgi:hypothetical protein
MASAFGAADRSAPQGHGPWVRLGLKPGATLVFVVDLVACGDTVAHPAAR